MDEPNDERTERTQPSQPVSPWTEPQATAPLPPAEVTAPLPPTEATTPLPPTEATTPLPAAEATTPLPAAEATTPLPPAGVPTESQPIGRSPVAPEFVAPAGEASELLVSNQQPWAVPSWEPDWSHGARWEPAQPRESDPSATSAAAIGPVVPEASWTGAPGQSPPPADPSGAYPPGGYPPANYPPGSYPPGVYGPGAYGSGGYGPGGYGPGGYGPGPNQPTGPERPKRGRKAAVLAAAALVLLGAGAGAGIAYTFRQDRGSSGALASSPPGKTLTTSQIEAEVSPAVVDIDTNLGEGTGIIAASNGEIITNNHVVEGATSIKVSILHRGTYTATVVGTDAKADVAVLRLSGVSGLPTVKFGDSSTIKVGSSVVAIGNSGGLNLLPSPATSGAVTALGRSITASDESGASGASENLKGMIQMNAQIQPGNSGGPLVDSSGEVVGMDTAAASTDSNSQTVIGFALPINRVLQIANDIERGKSGNGIVIGSVAFLGIAGETVQLQGSGQASGAGLEFVEPGSPADQAGIQQGDVIVAFNGHATTTMEALATLIHQLRPGDRATVTFLNTNGGRQTVTVTLGTGPPA